MFQILPMTQYSAQKALRDRNKRINKLLKTALTTTTTSILTTTTTTISAGPCAAETIYGEYSEQTELLRQYRDKVLSKTPEGQETIKTYYKFAPTITKLLENRPLLKNQAKVFLDRMLPGIRKKVEESTTLQ